MDYEKNNEYIKGHTCLPSKKRLEETSVVPAFSTQKLYGRQGQHTLEYMILLVLVMAGILIMGPYVVRSWNANLKGWEDSVIDSLQDPLIEVNYAIPGAACSLMLTQDVGCGLNMFDPCPTGAAVACGPFEMTQVDIYNPADCQCALPVPPQSARCTPSACCCTPPVATGQCGSSVVGGSTVPACANVVLNPLLAGGDCPAGEMGYTTVCGDGNTYWGCQPDLSCTVSCMGIPPNAAYATPCPDPALPLPGGPVAIDLVDAGGCNDWCQYECVPPYVVVDFSGTKRCAYCDSGEFYEGICPAGFCQTGLEGCGAMCVN